MLLNGWRHDVASFLDSMISSTQRRPIVDLPQSRRGGASGSGCSTISDTLQVHPTSTERFLQSVSVSPKCSSVIWQISFKTSISSVNSPDRAIKLAKNRYAILKDQLSVAETAYNHMTIVANGYKAYASSVNDELEQLSEQLDVLTLAYHHTFVIDGQSETDALHVDSDSGQFPFFCN